MKKFALFALFSAVCGLTPIKPVVPVGCRDLEPQCQCDEKGKNCGWKWICVKA